MPHRVQKNGVQLILDLLLRSLCRPIFKMSSPTDSKGNSLCSYDGGLHLIWTTVCCDTATIACHIWKLKITV